MAASANNPPPSFILDPGPPRRKQFGCCCCCHAAGLTFLAVHFAVIAAIIARCLFLYYTAMYTDEEQRPPNITFFNTSSIYTNYSTCFDENNNCQWEPSQVANFKMPSSPSNNYTLKDLAGDLKTGGIYEPMITGANCSTTRQRLAVIVPYRNREKHLKPLLFYLITYLKRHQIAFVIYVVEQIGDSSQSRFNRALLLNIGFVEANRRAVELGLPLWCCFAFHDVDRYPGPYKGVEHNYTCPPDGIFRQLSKKLERHFGGVGIINGPDFERVNGFSNLYFSYGKEDDEMVRRAENSGYQIMYDTADDQKTVKELFHADHIHESDNPENMLNWNLLNSVRQRQHLDGLNCLDYQVVDFIEYPTHTLIKVAVNEQRVFRRFFAKCATKKTAARVAQQLKISLKLYL